MEMREWPNWSAIIRVLAPPPSSSVASVFLKVWIMNQSKSDPSRTVREALRDVAPVRPAASGIREHRAIEHAQPHPASKRARFTAVRVNTMAHQSVPSPMMTWPSQQVANLD
jgi:hypothetical protein